MSIKSLETLEVWKKLINGYVVYWKRSEQGQNEPGINPAIREDTSSYNLESSDFPSDDSEVPNPE